MRRNLPENAKPERSLVPFLVLPVATRQRDECFYMFESLLLDLGVARLY